MIDEQVARVMAAAQFIRRRRDNNHPQEFGICADGIWIPRPQETYPCCEAVVFTTASTPLITHCTSLAHIRNKFRLSSYEVWWTGAASTVLRHHFTPLVARNALIAAMTLERLGDHVLSTDDVLDIARAIHERG